MLSKSCKNGSLADVKMHLAGGSTIVNEPDKWGRRPIYYAITSGHTHIVKELTESGLLDVKLPSKVPHFNKTELPIATCLRIKNAEMFDMLAKLVPYNYNEYLGVALKSDIVMFKQYINSFGIISLKGSEMLFCSHARLDHYDMCYRGNICIDLQSALKFTLVYRKYGCFNYLLKRVKYSEQLEYLYNCKGKLTLIGMAVIQGYLKGVIALVGKGASLTGFVVNSKQEMMNYLMYVCSNRSFYSEPTGTQEQIIATIRYIVTNGISVDYQNNTGLTALMVATRANNVQFVQVLLEYGADTTLTDMNGKNAHDYVDESLGFGQISEDSAKIKQLLTQTLQRTDP